MRVTCALSRSWGMIIFLSLLESLDWMDSFPQKKSIPRWPDWPKREWLLEWLSNDTLLRYNDQRELRHPSDQTRTVVWPQHKDWQVEGLPTRWGQYFHRQVCQNSKLLEQQQVTLPTTRLSKYMTMLAFNTTNYEDIALKRFEENIGVLNFYFDTPIITQIQLELRWVNKSIK